MPTFDSEADANEAAYLWSQALGFSVEAKKRRTIPDDNNATGRTSKL
ncbi:hypothetical protein [Sinorhizobium chiapasense]|uniref:Uncharacterized protein n=1 Tax=Sinorhizobium chiapasense TaxID=501572 RepID=A0ABZ2BC41_9HYPH